MTDQTRLLNGRYRVGKLIGRGGMGQVFLGTDTRLGRTVAIKILRTAYADDPNFRLRFRAEAQAAARMNHPNIVRTYDTGEDEFIDDDGNRGVAPFIVMEFVEGKTVKQLIRAGELSVRDAVRLTRDVLAALEYAHRAGIVHRDIKPGNIMVSISGQVKVMDFGVAKAIAESSTTQALSGGIVGTATYFAPEQAKGETVDQRADLYSTGITLFEMLTGQPPFSGESPAAVAYQHVNQAPPPIRELNPEVPASLAAVVLTALAKDPARRYQSARDFADDLDAVAAGRTPRLVAAGVLGADAAGDAGALNDDTQLLQTTPTSGEDPFGALTGSETFTAPVPVQPTSKKSGVAGIWIAVGAFVLIAAAALIWFLTLKPVIDLEARKVTLPDVVNSAEAQAQSTLEALELVVTTSEEYSDVIDAGNVISSDPVANTVVLKGSTVALVISKGQEQKAVPPLESVSIDVAQQRLTDAGFVVGQITTEDSATVSQDLVLRTSPVAGESVPIGSTIDIVKSSGYVDVPSVVGNDFDQAVETLKNLGFTSTGTPSYTCSGVRNTVVNQNPPAGRVAANTRITLTYVNTSRCGIEGEENSSQDGDDVG